MPLEASYTYVMEDNSEVSHASTIRSFRVLRNMSIISAFLLTLLTFGIVFSRLLGLGLNIVLFGPISVVVVSASVIAIPSLVVGVLTTRCAKLFQNLSADPQTQFEIEWGVRIGLYVTVLAFILLFYGCWFFYSSENITF